MSFKYPPINYDVYLQLNQLLSAQSLRSEKFEKPAHDEMLFIIVHQVYELWFKQILTEIDSINTLFCAQEIQEKDMSTVVSRLGRVNKIFRILIDQIEIMETMTPLDFLEFRDMLFPASGFQSFQFRLLENKLGLPAKQRLQYNSKTYDKSLSKEAATDVLASEKAPNLFQQVNKWLERTPFLSIPGFDFWENYKSSVEKSFSEEKQIIEGHTSLSDSDKSRNLEILNSSRTTFDSLFDEELFQKACAEGTWKLSYKAVHAALLIQLYRDQPIFQLPFEIIRSLLDLDELMTTWRYRHALMAKRMLGTKIGTGGSSGYDYLKKTSETHKIFDDFYQLTTFFIPRSQLPELPEEVKNHLGFSYQSNP